MASASITPPSPFPKTRQLIWVYFWLLIFEGALRKWILPGLSNPLLIIRDPVAVAIYAMALKEGCFPRNKFIPFIVALAAVCGMASMMVIPDHPLITAYGLRADFLHLPLVFLLPRVLTPNEVQRIGFFVLLLAFLMALLVYKQFTSPSGAWANNGAGIGSGQIESTFDRIRPAGTFSYSNGLLCYISLLGSFVFYGFLRSGTYPKWLLVGSVPCLFLMVALSGSRSVLASMSLLVITAVGISLFKPKMLGGSARALFAIGAVYLVAGSWVVIQQGVEVHESRLSGGGGVKEGLIDRYIGTLLPMDALQNTPFLGFGLGMGTNAAAGLLTGDRGFLLAESEWDRVIMESGALLGFAYIALRIVIVFKVADAGLARIRRGDPLSVLLFSGFALQMLNGQFAQPAALGFGVFGMGLCLAATVPDDVPTQVRPHYVSRTPQFRTRSRYAERFHGG